MVIRQVTRPYHRHIWLHIQVLFLWTVAKHCLQQAQKFWLILIFTISSNHICSLFLTVSLTKIHAISGQRPYFLSHDCIPNTQHGVWHKTCLLREKCLLWWNEETCHLWRDWAGKLYLLTCLIEYLCSSLAWMMPRIIHTKWTGNGGNYADKSGRMNHPLQHQLSGYFMWKLFKTQRAGMIAYSLHFTWFCGPSCRQTWEWLPIWRVAPSRYGTQTCARTGARENRSGRETGEGSRSLAFQAGKPACLAFSRIHSPPHQVCITGAKVITLWPWRFGLALSWTLVGRKDWADRHTSKGDTFFNLGFKKTTGKNSSPSQEV